MRKVALAASAAAAVAAAAIALALFSEIGPPEPARPDPWEYDPEAAAECERAGGEYFLAEIYVCQMPVGDEGESCTDSSQCEDLCVLDPLLYGDEDLEGREGLEGRCAAFSHGCDLVLEGGRAGWMCG